MSDVEWCCLCEDPFEPSMVPPMTFPITPCKDCDARMMKEVVDALRREGTWRCTHPCKGCCLYCEKLTVAARLKTRGPHSLRTLAMCAIFKDDGLIYRTKALFDKDHPVWTEALPKLPALKNGKRKRLSERDMQVCEYFKCSNAKEFIILTCLPKQQDQALERRRSADLQEILLKSTKVDTIQDELLRPKSRTTVKNG